MGVICLVVLGIDPGYAIVGYGLVSFENNKLKPVQFGVIRTQSSLPIDARLLEIYNDLSDIISTHKPDAMAVEKLFFNTNQKTAIDVSQARGVAVLAGALNHVPFYEYTPLQVKMAVVGYGRAEKQQIMELTRTLLGLSVLPKPDDAADALAIAICHAHSANNLILKNT